MSDNIPEEIVTQILARLPIKTLIQCTTVCKTWHSLIKSPVFIDTHLTINQTQNTHLFLFRHCPNNPQKEHYSLYLDNKEYQLHTKLYFPFQSINECFRLVGSFNGLVLLSDDYHSDSNTLIIWNPSIRKSITFAKFPISSQSHTTYYDVLGFGFDYQNNDYKVVRIVYFIDEHQVSKGNTPEAEIYSLKSRSWKSIKGPKYEVVRTSWSQAFVNEGVHWIGFERRGNGFNNVILGLDMNDEIFKEIVMPNCLVTDSPWDMIISAVGGCISIFHYDQYREKCCYIWVMMEYGVTESWTKKFSVDLDVSPDLKLVQVMGLKKNGDLLVEMCRLGGKKGELVSHDSKTKDNEFHGVLTDPGCSSVLSYMESLLLLNE